MGIDPFESDHQHIMKTNPIDLSEHCTVVGCEVVLTDEQMDLIARSYMMGFIDDI